jgi:hypothetical protein
MPSLAQLVRLAEFYSAPRRAWMSKTFEGGDLRPATLGFLVFLLMNGSVGPEQAFRIPDQEADERRVALSVVPVVNAFVEGIGGKPLQDREASQLSGNWAVTESRRQLPGLVRHLEGPKRRVERIYIEAGRSEAVIAAIARSLRRRPRLDAAVLGAALAETEAEYSNARPSLRAWGLSWESADATNRLTQSILRAFETAS